MMRKQWLVEKDRDNRGSGPDCNRADTTVVAEDRDERQSHGNPFEREFALEEKQLEVRAENLVQRLSGGKVRADQIVKGGLRVFEHWDDEDERAGGES